MKKILIGIISIVLFLFIVWIIFYNLLFIGKEEAKKIVFKHMNINENEAKKIDISFEYESGSWEYNVEFIYNNQEYDYTIDAKNGDIILHQIDK